ncbi:MAG: tRNA (adenosine(37)-N6)-dimethylallyltransferase MiaA [Bacteroidales bacterium]|nr:tRNA (adenosine(37)-N6)-dimethylallyltransferase MiaA [Bacteroidales bacterium]
MNCPLLVITGPTASGKTSRGVDCARAFGGEIVSADSRQLYRGMDIGTGKDLCEYGEVPYHMIDVVPAGYKYNLFEYLRDAGEAIRTIRDNGKLPVVVGGTGMYVEALLNGLQLPEVPADPELRASLEGKSLAELTDMLSRMKQLHNTTDVDTAKRAIRAIEIAVYYERHPEAARQAVPHPVEGAVTVGVDIPRDMRRERISRRLRTRLDEGMVDEIRDIIASGVTPDDLIYYGLEYKFVTKYVLGRMTYDEMVSALETAIHQFAKRQMTWFRGMERRGHRIHWLPYDLPRRDFVEAVGSLL